MPQSDPDDRLLAALRGERVTGEDPTEAAELRAASRIGAAARRAAADGDDTEHPAPTPEPMVMPEIEASARSATDTELIPLRRRRLGNWVPTLAAAAIAIIAGAILLLSRDDAEQVALVDLDPLTESGMATAELVNDGGRYELRVAVEGIVPDGGYLEVWLINSAVTELVSFGPIESSGTYLLPDGLDPADFPVVDVSIEALDGDPTHSGQSVFRGQFSL